MYAVIRTGGKQYKVTEGAQLKVEKLVANEGDNIDFNEVLLLSDGENVNIGTPLVTGSKVTATVQGQGRGKKIKIVKMRRRKHHRKQMGHRQYLTSVKITGLFLNDQKLEAKPAPTVVAEPPESEVTPPAGAVTENG
jgi:large subunit ribosomal protein L21